MIPVALLFSVAVHQIRGLAPILSADHPPGRSGRFSTILLSEATLSPPTIAETNHVRFEPPPSSSSDASTRKRLGKSSFLYKQRTSTPERRGGISTTTETAAASLADELRKLAEKHSGKTVGSAQYKKAWTRWLYLAVESIREDLGERLLVPGRGITTNDDDDDDDADPRAVRRAFEELFFDLGVAADEGTMPSFASGDARTGYALEFFCRARALAEFFLESPARGDDDGVYPGFWTRSLRGPGCPILGADSSSLSSAEAAPRSERASTYEIVSLGGGPGFDFVGVALAAAFSFHAGGASDSGTAPGSPATIHVTAMDYEEGWSDLVSAMDRSTRKLLAPSSSSSSGLPAMSCDWGGKCDITKSILREPVNARCKSLLLGDGDGRRGKRESSSRLWICQYCVAENARALRDSDYVFFKELVREASAGTLVLLTEVVPRLWPELVRMLDREGLLPLVDVGFRTGYRGKQFLLRKRETRRPATVATGGSAFESLDEETRDQLEHFERLASYHDRKVGSGWKRQGRKANGSATYHEEREIHRRGGSAGGDEA